MEQASNEIRSTLSTSIRSPIEILNLTGSLDVAATTAKATTLDHVTATDIRKVHDIYSRLGYGDLSDVVTQTMLCAIAVGSMLLLVIWYLFIRQIPYIVRHTPTKYLARTLMLCGVYTIVGSAALVSLIAYRAFVFCDSVCHFAFLLCAYQYFALVIDYAGGESNFIKNTRGTLCFNVRTPPLCCCLHFLLPSPVTKDKFKFLRLMVLQMPIVQGILLALLNVFNSIDTILYEQVQPFFTIFIVASIMCGVWSLQINSRMIAAHLPDYKIMHKYFAIQLVLILYKLQPVLIHAFCFGVETATGYRINSKVIENAVIQLIILLETIVLSYFANRVYTVPTKAIEPN